MAEKTFTLLLVEDDYLDAFITKKYLRDSLGDSYEIKHVTDGLSAIDYLLKRKKYRGAATPDLVVLDLRLPGLSGTEILRFASEHSELRKIPMVVISGEPKTLELQGTSTKLPYPVFVKWVAMKDFKTIVKAAEDMVQDRRLSAVSPSTS